MDGFCHGKHYFLMDDLGVPLFLETPMYIWLKFMHGFLIVYGSVGTLLTVFPRRQFQLQKLSVFPNSQHGEHEHSDQNPYSRDMNHEILVCL